MMLTWIEGGLTRVPGVKVGHADHPDGYTGVTVALFDQAVPGGVEITGGGSGTRQFGALDPTHVAGRVHAVVFAGGSAFGLDTGTGVVAWLEERGIGLPVSETQVIPIVPTAIVFDLMVAGDARPTAALARTACDAASRDPVAEGSVGAGRGATVGKCTGQ
ncbi:MAG: P1 family peptidase, partial [Candidatus Hydrogenedentes bacterium]|nr:P1 family peptidase [Candidatus Hydrogenedentota bacterium]